MKQIGIFPQNIRNCFHVKKEAKILTRKQWALVSWPSAFNAERPAYRPDRNENRVNVINAKQFDGEPCGRDSIDFLFPLYGPMSCGGDQSTGPIREECSGRRAVLLKILANTTGDDGWTSMGISCSLQTAPAS